MLCEPFAEAYPAADFAETDAGAGGVWIWGVGAAAVGLSRCIESRSGTVHDEHRLSADGPAVHRVVGELWIGKRVGEFAGVRGDGGHGRCERWTAGIWAGISARDLSAHRAAKCRLAGALSGSAGRPRCGRSAGI